MAAPAVAFLNPDIVFLLSVSTGVPGLVPSWPTNLPRRTRKPVGLLEIVGAPSADVQEVSRLRWKTHGVSGKQHPGLRALVVDDEENISYLVAAALRNNGFEVLTADSGATAVSSARSFNPHVIVLDVMLPDFDGIEVVRRLRSAAVTSPVIFLSARGSTDDRVRGLTAGGDDYIVKPFALEELLARVEAQIRRSGAGSDPPVIEVHDLVMDVDAHRVWRSGAEVHLSGTEFTLLRFLMQNAGRVLTRAQILDHVWQYDFGGEGAIIETYVSHLRKKLEEDGTRLIHTVRGIGYSLRVPG